MMLLSNPRLPNATVTSPVETMQVDASDSSGVFVGRIEPGG
jgi:hypothetical protein